MNFQLQFISDQSNYVFSYLEPPGHVTDLMSPEKWPLVDLEKYLAYSLSNFMNFQHQFIDNQSNKRYFILGTSRTRHRFEVSGEMATCRPGTNHSMRPIKFHEFFGPMHWQSKQLYLFILGTTRPCHGFLPQRNGHLPTWTVPSMWSIKFHEFSAAIHW